MNPYTPVSINCGIGYKDELPHDVSLSWDCLLFSKREQLKSAGSIMNIGHILAPSRGTLTGVKTHHFYSQCYSSMVI